MNHVNPLYVGLFLIFVLGVSIFKLADAKEELTNVKSSYQKTLSLANDLASLKSAYKNNKKLRAILNAAKVDTKYKKNSVKISSSSMDKRTLTSLMSKLLNSATNISSLEIKKLSPQKVSLRMEIKW